MLDRAHLGRDLPSHTALVEAGRLRFFAKAIGETRAEYLDVTAAHEAGYRDLPAPPSFLFALNNDGTQFETLLDMLGMQLGRVLHGEQSFTYYRDVCAGDMLTFRSRIEELYDRKGGFLEFAVILTHVSDQAGRPVADLRTVLVQRNG